MFDEVCIVGLDYVFKILVDIICDLRNFVEIYIIIGSIFWVIWVILIILFNVFYIIKFDFFVFLICVEVFCFGYVNYMFKIYVEVKGDIVFWCGLIYFVKLMFGYSDGFYFNGNIYIVIFGVDEMDDFVFEKNFE